MNNSLRIAVADDEQDVRDYYQRVLPRLGHQLVGVASNGKELIDLCRALHPDLIIADIKMPEMDGIEAAEEISREGPIPTILVSAYHRPQLFERARGDHVLAYLVKPTKQADLEAAIAIAMQRFEQFQALRKESADRGLALEERKVIERAKGLMMKRHGLDEEEAYLRLRRTARDRNAKLAEIARQVIAGQDPEGPAGADAPAPAASPAEPTPAPETSTP